MKNTNSGVIVFKNPILEALTHVNPWTPLILWLPTTVFLLWRAHWLNDLSYLPLTLVFLAGVVVWTLAEYALHRYAFHFPAKSDFAKRIVFITHGLHHDDPKDPTRLVMPPAPAFLYILFFYALFRLVFGPVLVDPFLAGFLAGYLAYDYIHYGTHHWRPKTKIGRILRKNHLGHHATHEEVLYGVSSPLWDHIFGTYRGRK